MKSVKYKLKAKGTKVNIEVVDLLGGIHKTSRTLSLIQSQRYVDDGIYKVKTFDVQDWFKDYFKEGIHVANQSSVMPAKIRIVKKYEIDIKLDIELLYYWNKPIPDVEEGITYEEITND